MLPPNARLRCRPHGCYRRPPSWQGYLPTTLELGNLRGDTTVDLTFGLREGGKYAGAARGRLGSQKKGGGQGSGGEDETVGRC